MDKSAIQNQLWYIIAKEQYMKPLFQSEIITEEVYNEVLENLYNEFEVWRYIKANIRKHETTMHI